MAIVDEQAGGDELEVDEDRRAEHRDIPGTGIFVRAHFRGGWGTYDIAVLTHESMRRWLRQGDGQVEWAESVVFALLGYPPYDRAR